MVGAALGTLRERTGAPGCGMQAGNPLPCGEPGEDPTPHPSPPPRVQTDAQLPARDLPSAFQLPVEERNILEGAPRAPCHPPRHAPPPGLSQGARTLENVPEARATRAEERRAVGRTAPSWTPVPRNAGDRHSERAGDRREPRVPD